MVLITDVDYDKMQFSGGNLHYLRPGTRKMVAGNWADGALSYPMRCHHKYFMSSATRVYNVPNEELNDMTPLPVEQFVIQPKGIGKILEVPSAIIWGRLK